jgi:hypothetical protein
VLSQLSQWSRKTAARKSIVFQTRPNIRAAVAATGPALADRTDVFFIEILSREQKLARYVRSIFHAWEVALARRTLWMAQP